MNSKNLRTSYLKTQGYSPIPTDIEEEEIRQTSNGKSKKISYGKAWKTVDGEYKRYRCYDFKTEYKPGDSVFIESQRPDQPFYICNITEFKKSKRDNLMVCIRWFYRTSEVPEQVYNLLIQVIIVTNVRRTIVLQSKLVKPH